MENKNIVSGIVINVIFMEDDPHWAEIYFSLKLLNWHRDKLILFISPSNKQNEWMVDLWYNNMKNQDLPDEDGHILEWEGMTLVLVQMKDHKGIIIRPKDWDKFIGKTMGMNDSPEIKYASKEEKEDSVVNLFLDKEEGEENEHNG